MKIKELKERLIKITSVLNVGYVEQSTRNQLISKFSKLNQFRKALDLLDDTGLFSNEIKLIRDSAIFTTAKDNLNLNSTEGRLLKNQVDEIVKLTNALHNTISEISGESNIDSISIKLPPINDFEDLAKVSSELHKILTQAIVNDEINGQVRIDSVENGSIWLDIYLGSAAAVSLVGSLSWAAAVIYKKVQEGKIFEEHAKSLSIKNDSLQEIQKKQKEALAIMIDAEARNLYDENFSGNNNEQIERLKNSIKLLSNLIEKGAEVHPALNQPEKVKNLFPKMNQLQTVESKIKKLE